VAATQRVCSRERHDFLVAEAHAVEDGAEVVRPLGAVGQPAVGGGAGAVSLGKRG
jgi:hypothetical protein